MTQVRLSTNQLQHARNAGFEERDSVSAALDLVVARDPDKETIKIKRANELGIQVVTLDDFLNRIGYDLTF